MYTHIYISFEKFFTFYTRYFTVSLSHTLSSQFLLRISSNTLPAIFKLSFSFRIMSTTAFEIDGAKFVTNNYAAILDNDEAPKEFHLIQDFLAHSELMYALTQPESISPSQVLTF